MPKKRRANGRNKPAHARGHVSHPLGPAGYRRTVLRAAGKRVWNSGNLTSDFLPRLVLCACAV